MLRCNVNDATAFGQVLDSIRIPPAVTGRPRTTPVRVLGDKAYSSWAIRHLLRYRGTVATIPERRDQMANRRRRGTHGGPPTRLRQGHLPQPQRGRTMLRPSQAVPCDRDKVRQARRSLPGWNRPGSSDPVAP
ncbi:transposase [Streptomyces sp. SID89]|nr:transposase [Streptomyces sp. SID89]